MPSSLAAMTRECPCGSVVAYHSCCGPLHDGQAATTAEALMRSRYSAYATGHLDHVFRTWHPRTRPAGLTLRDVQWLGLEIVRTVNGGVEDDTGLVEFRARFRGPEGAALLHEESRFERRAGRWVYVDGEVGGLS